jgi:hypothetical protein
MFAEVICGALVDASAPLLSVAALRSLIRLLDCQREQEPSWRHENRFLPNAADTVGDSLPTNAAAPGVKHTRSENNVSAVCAADRPASYRDYSHGKKGAKQ